MPDFATVEEYKEYKRLKHYEMLSKQCVPYSVKIGWGEVLDYLDIPWRDPEHWYLDVQLPGQMNIFDYI